MDGTSEPDPDWVAALEGAARGDLRPQFNSLSLLRCREVPRDRVAFQNVLRQRFLEFSRPIADASRGVTPGMRLSDAGQFFYLIEALQRLGYTQLDDALLMLLDEFLELEPSAYNELHLWSIVQLSRNDRRHIDTFWPMVIALDQRYRSEAWIRPAGTAIVEQPYRLTELLFYLYVLYTLHQEPKPKPVALSRARIMRYPSLGARLVGIAAYLSLEQLDFVGEVLTQLDRQEGRFVFGDAHGLIENSKRERAAAKPPAREGV